MEKMSQMSQALKSKGLVVTVLFFIFTVACIFLAGFQYRYVYHEWTSVSPYRAMGPLELTVVVVAFVVAILGFLIFTCVSSKPLVIMFIALNVLSMLLTMSIAIFTLIAGTIGNLDKYVGCQTPYKRIFKYWEYLDKYFREADQLLCSDECPCTFTDVAEKLYQNDPTTSPVFSAYKYETQEISKLGKDKGTRKIQNCPEGVLTKLKDRQEKYLDLHNNKIKKFKQDKFHKFWEYIENKFECTGFCATVYVPDPELTNNPLKQVPMIKYLFSNVNKGPVKNRGCMQPLLKYVSDLLISFGSLSLFASILQLVLLTFGVSMFKLLSFMENPPAAGQPSQSEQMGIIGGDEQKNLKVNEEEERHKNHGEEVIRENNNLQQREENN